MGGVRVAVKPDVKAVSPTMPEKPFRLDRVMLEERDVPAGINKSMGLGEIPKLGPTTSTVTEAYSDKAPFVPVMITV